MNDECDYCGAPCDETDKGCCPSCQPVESASLASIIATVARQERNPQRLGLVP